MFNLHDIEKEYPPRRLPLGHLDFTTLTNVGINFNNQIRIANDNLTTWENAWFRLDNQIAINTANSNTWTIR